MSVSPCVVRGVSLLRSLCCLPRFRRRSAGREASESERGNRSLSPGYLSFQLYLGSPVVLCLFEPIFPRSLSFCWFKKKSRGRETTVVCRFSCGSGLPGGGPRFCLQRGVFITFFLFLFSPACSIWTVQDSRAELG